MSDPRPPEGADTTRPSPARLYDYYLGGKDNYPVDREVANDLLEQIPELRDMARANRCFQRRAVQYMARQGITQFLDLGSGLPAQDPTHEVAQAIDPKARVVYVDHDPLAVAHASAMLAGDPDRTAVVAADLREPWSILSHRETTRLIDFSRPVGVLLVAVLHFFSDDAHPHEIVRTLREALSAGSFMAISHVDNETAPDRAAQLEQMYATTSAPGQARSHNEIKAFFDGLTLVHPGLSYVCHWRLQPGDPYWAPARAWVQGGVGRL